MGRNKESIIGIRFDKRVVLELTVSSPHKRWLVVCDCGAKFDCLMQDLRRGGNCRNCYYCDSTLKWSEFRDRKQFGSNLDRKDSSKGYTLDNVVPCCRVCNITKNNNFTHEEFILLGKVITQINTQRALALLQLELENETKEKE